MRIGFIGQGYVGRNYADWFSSFPNGNRIIRYSLEPEFITNKEKIRTCDIVIIAVPTPTTREHGPDSKAVTEAISLIGLGKTAVIKSTVIPGTTDALQEANPELFIFHSPEFLSEQMAYQDVKAPRRSIIGSPVDSPIYANKANELLQLFPWAPYRAVMTAKESELIKYISNAFYFSKVVLMNVMFNSASAIGCDWEKMRDAMSADNWIGGQHTNIVSKGGRGAGGACLIKDFEAFRIMYKSLFENDIFSNELLDALASKNCELLIKTGKDHKHLKSVYGDFDPAVWNNSL